MSETKPELPIPTHANVERDNDQTDKQIHQTNDQVSNEIVFENDELKTEIAGIRGN